MRVRGGARHAGSGQAKPHGWLGHLRFCCADGREWTFGERWQKPKPLVDFTPSAASALVRFWAPLDRRPDSGAAVIDEQLDTVGSDPDAPFTTVLSGADLEFIHHMAEIALLRHLATGRRSPDAWARARPWRNGTRYRFAAPFRPSDAET